MLWILGITCSHNYDECILSFEQHIDVQKDGELLIKEDITVLAKGKRIKRGIYREFPMRYKRNGINYSIDFDLVKVLRDGREENYFTKRTDSSVRIYIGKKEVFLKEGVYEYTMIYRVKGQIGHFKDHDELYWNVNGTRWEFPINKVRAIVKLPAVPSDSIIYTAYTGRYGESGKDYTAYIDDSGRVVFESVKEFAPGENLTIVVGWPKGYVKEGGFLKMIKESFPAKFLIISILYYLILWIILGRDIPKGTIVPRFRPPKNLSPAAVRFIMNMGYDTGCLVANILSLAVKGMVKIKNPSEGLYFIDRKDVKVRLRSDERIVLNKIGKKGLIISEDNFNEDLAHMDSALENNLMKRFGKYFRINTIYTYIPPLIYLVIWVWFFIRGLRWNVILHLDILILILLLIGTVGLIALLILGYTGGENIGEGTLGPLGTIPYLNYALAMMYYTVEQALYKLTRKTKLRYFSRNFVNITILILGVMLLTGLLIVFSALKPSWHYFISLFGFIAVLITAWIWDYYMRSPTKEGRKLMDEIEGFKMFLKTAEKEKMRHIYNEDLAVIYERFLPYAYALDIVDVWVKKFEGSLKDYKPVWYNGRGSFGIPSIYGLSAALGAFVIDIPEISLSEGFGGLGGSSGFSGGFSGGGGGGGGGGGW